MIKHALLVVPGFLSFCFCLAAQPTSRMEQTKDETTTLEQLRHTSALDTPATLTLSERRSPVRRISVLMDDAPVLTLWDGQRLPLSSELGGMGMAPLDLFPDTLPDAAEVEKGDAAPVDGKDSPAEVVHSPLNPIYFGGEVGFLYGRSSGKFGREIMQTYFLGEVGNDKFHITVGAAYEESNGRLPRFRSFTGPR
jgi:hypothetical protein